MGFCFEGGKVPTITGRLFSGGWVVVGLLSELRARVRKY